VVLFGGCSFIDTVPYEKGAIWCNEPLKYDHGVPFDKTHLDVARYGYIYALAGAYVLQDNLDEDKDHWFVLPPRMKEVDRPQRDDSGFEVRTFELRHDLSDPEPSEIIVAYTGSNDSADWAWTNLWFDQTQYKLARSYLLNTVKKYPGKQIVVTGYSLGAGLAGHVTKHEDTAPWVSQAWLFNPSPKIYANDRREKKISVGALRGELLGKIRSRPFEWFWPGVNRIGAPWDQNAQDYYLISAFPIYGHYRWALARNILFVADFAHLQDPAGSGPADPRHRLEPRQILESSQFKACEHDTAARNKVLNGQGDAQKKATGQEKQRETSINP